MRPDALRKPAPLLPAMDALLAVDVGNSRIGLGVWSADGYQHAERVDALNDEAWSGAIERAWSRIAPAGDRRAVVVSSVSPRIAEEFCMAAEDVCGVRPQRIRDDLPLPMTLDLEEPDEVGIDRVCAAAAAHERFGGACAVASFGTAITVDCVSDRGEFLGGAILPGIQMAFDALHENTAALPLVTPAQIDGRFGRSTVEAIRHGVILGAVGALRELVERYATALNAWPPLVITGGNADLVLPHADFVDACVPDLCLMGVALAYRRASGQS